MQLHQYAKNSSKPDRLKDRTHTGRHSTIAEKKIQEIQQILDNESVPRTIIPIIRSYWILCEFLWNRRIFVEIGLRSDICILSSGLVSDFIGSYFRNLIVIHSSTMTIL